MAGRGSFIESLPLFGYDLDDYDELFAEMLELLLALRESEHLPWARRDRPALDGQSVYPRPLLEPLPVWVAVGGTPQSVVRALLNEPPRRPANHAAPRWGPERHSDLFSFTEAGGRAAGGSWPWATLPRVGTLAAGASVGTCTSTLTACRPRCGALGSRPRCASQPRCEVRW